MKHYYTYLFWKRLFDCCAAGFALILLAPIMAAAAIAVRQALGKPVLFRQLRPGLAGMPFELLKFRTMTDGRDDQGRLLPDHERLTRLSIFLRHWSLDELPQLWNVLRGDMSLIGPRPLLMEYLSRYTPEQARRHEVRPGITGWAQVHGRNAISWQEKFRLDVWYVDHVCPVVDLAILVRTVLKVLRREGISATAHATMPHFEGPHSYEREPA